VVIFGTEFHTIVTEGSVITVPLVAADNNANPVEPLFTFTVAVPVDPVVAVAPPTNVGVIAPIVVGALNVTVLPEIGFP
jgi:hypothetical protein